MKLFVLYADSVNEEPSVIRDQGDLTKIMRDRLRSVRHALEDNVLDKKENNLKYTDKEKLKEEFIGMNMVLEHVKIIGITQCKNVMEAVMRIAGEEIGMKKLTTKYKRNHSGKEET